jgi:hypothetical protein
MWRVLEISGNCENYLHESNKRINLRELTIHQDMSLAELVQANVLGPGGVTEQQEKVYLRMIRSADIFVTVYLLNV